MASSVISAGKNANLVGAGNGPKKVRTRTETLAVMRAAQSIWPMGRVANLVAVTGASETTAKEWIRGERDMRLDHFARLLATENGLQFLDAATAARRPGWWRLIQAIVGAATARKLQAAAQRTLQRAVTGAFNADAEISASINRAEHLLAHDADFHSEHFTALRAIARVPDRPRTQTKGKRK